MSRLKFLQMVDGLGLPNGLSDELRDRWTWHLPALWPELLRCEPDEVRKALHELQVRNLQKPPAPTVAPVADQRLLVPVNGDIVIPQSDDGFKVDNYFHSQNPALKIFSVSSDFTALTMCVAVDPQPERRLASFGLSCAMTDSDIRRELGTGHEVDFAALRFLLEPEVSRLFLTRQSLDTSNVFYMNTDILVSCYYVRRGFGDSGWRFFANYSQNSDAKWPVGTRIFRSKK